MDGIVQFKKSDFVASTQYSEIIEKSYNTLLKQYKGKKTVEVDFRKLVDWVPYSDSETHYIHSYPAKLLKHIPIFFLNSPIAPKSGIVLDPFCGTGTVLLETIKVGLNAYGFDANPVARLISKVKTTPIDVQEAKNLLSSIIKNRSNIDKTLNSPNVTNIDHWFLPQTQIQLNHIKNLIDKTTTNNYNHFFNICFSNILKKVSLADPNLSVPVRLKPQKYIKEELRKKAFARLKSLEHMDVFKVFETQVNHNLDRMSKLLQISNLGVAQIIGNDAKKLMFDTEDNVHKKIADNSIDMIITSPPYAGAQKYVRASSFSLGWLGLCEQDSLKSYENKSIGREHYRKSEYQSIKKLNIEEIDNRIKDIYKVNPLRAQINGNYLIEMNQAINEMYRVLKPDCYCVLVMGNNEVCGKLFNTQHYINLLAERAGFKTELKLIDDIHSRGLMTKRNKTASVINSEWIMIIRK